MDLTSRRDSETRSAPLAPAPALSPTHSESLASVPASCVRCFAHLVMQPKPGRGPMSFHRRWRKIQRTRSFFNGKATEKSQFDNATLLLVKPRQFIQRVVESDHVHAPGLERQSVIQDQSVASIPLGGVAAA